MIASGETELVLEKVKMSAAIAHQGRWK